MHWAASEEHEALLLVCHLFFTETDTWAEHCWRKISLMLSWQISSMSLQAPFTSHAKTVRSTFVFSPKTTMAQPPSLHFSRAPLTREGISTITAQFIQTTSGFHSHTKLLLAGKFSITFQHSDFLHINSCSKPPVDHLYSHIFKSRYLQPAWLFRKVREQ